MLRLLLLSVLLAAPALAQAPVLIAELADGAPVPFVSGGVVYQYDDGAANVTLGPPPSFDPDMLWGNYYLTEPGGEVITEVSVAFGRTFPSVAGGVTIWLLEDTDADFDPRNATARASVTVVPELSGDVEDRDSLYVFELPPTMIEGGFFVGASAQLLGGQDAPARVDRDSRADRSWYFYEGNIAEVIDDLASAAFGTRMDDATNVPFPGAFMVRAVGEARPVTGEDSPEGVATLHAPAPNPSVGDAAISFSLARAATVRLDVVDALGRTVATLADGERAPGLHRASLDRALAPGIYVVRLVADGVAAARTLTVGR